jgi:hypothetical protein
MYRQHTLGNGRPWQKHAFTTSHQANKTNSKHT